MVSTDSMAKKPLHLIQAQRMRNFYLLLMSFFMIILIFWVGIPILMTVMWSLVDPKNPWSYPNLFPPSFSLAQWKYVFDYTNIGRALRTSYSLAPLSMTMDLQAAARSASSS